MESHALGSVCSLTSPLEGRSVFPTRRVWCCVGPERDSTGKRGKVPDPVRGGGMWLSPVRWVCWSGSPRPEERERANSPGEGESEYFRAIPPPPPPGPPTLTPAERLR
ncbi:unnamed protein product [Gadus morhua 'NCC']